MPVCCAFSCASFMTKRSHLFQWNLGIEILWFLRRHRPFFTPITANVLKVGKLRGGTNLEQKINLKRQHSCVCISLVRWDRSPNNAEVSLGCRIVGHHVCEYHLDYTYAFHRRNRVTLPSPYIKKTVTFEFTILV